MNGQMLNHFHEERTMSHFQSKTIFTDLSAFFFLGGGGGGEKMTLVAFYTSKLEEIYRSVNLYRSVNGQILNHLMNKGLCPIFG